jgi:hypothetical protein
VHPALQPALDEQPKADLHTEKRSASITPISCRNFSHAIPCYKADLNRPSLRSRRAAFRVLSMGESSAECLLWDRRTSSRGRSMMRAANRLNSQTP